MLLARVRRNRERAHRPGAPLSSSGRVAPLVPTMKAQHTLAPVDKGDSGSGKGVLALLVEAR